MAASRWPWAMSTAMATWTSTCCARRHRRGDDDVLLLSRRGGQAWRAIRVPSRPGGVADDVYPIDHDADGRTDFLALNGKDSTPGPVQLIASYPD